MKRPDPLTLTVGLACVLFGALALAYTVEVVPATLATVLIPVILIFCGVAGLALSRIRPSTRPPKGN